MAADRPPFDAADEAQARRYLEARGLVLIDPAAEQAPKDDFILTRSLANARFVVQQSFGTVNAAGQPFRAYPFYVGRPFANAFAVERAGLQLMGIDIGLATATYEMSLFVFAQTTLFTEIGDAACERSPDLPNGSQLAFWIADRLRARGTPDGPPIGTKLISKDPRRQLAAYFLTHLMLRFVWLHEFYHGLNGHTGLLAAERPRVVLNDMPDEAAIGLVEEEPEPERKAYRRLRHAMEHDADRSALWMLVRMQQENLEQVSGLAVWPTPQRLKLSIFAAAMMTFLFDQAALRQAKRTDATHPAARYRLVDLVRTLASHLTEPPGEVKQAFKAALDEMTALQKCLPQFVSAGRLIGDINDVELQRSLDETEDALRVARRRFAKFAYRNGAFVTKARVE